MTLTHPVPALYRFIYLWLEPLSIFSGAFYAQFMQSDYLRLTHASSAPGSSVPISTSIVMTQLANLYLGLGLLEALVLRATSELRVWRTFLFVLLVADIGHLYSVAAVGNWVYWDYSRWNPIDWGNVPFVYFLAITRSLLLLGVGFNRSSDGKKRL